MLVHSGRGALVSSPESMHHMANILFQPQTCFTNFGPLHRGTLRGLYCIDMNIFWSCHKHKHKHLKQKNTVFQRYLFHNKINVIVQMVQVASRSRIVPRVPSAWRRCPHGPRTSGGEHAAAEHGARSQRAPSPDLGTGNQSCSWSPTRLVREQYGTFAKIEV